MFLELLGVFQVIHKRDITEAPSRNFEEYEVFKSLGLYDENNEEQICLICFISVHTY